MVKACFNCMYRRYDEHNFNAYCGNDLLCFNYSRYEQKERTYVNMFVDDMKKEETVERCDSVNNPPHYNKGIEAIEYIESHNFNFNLGNAIKYITRCEYKGNKKEDIKKAIWYLERELNKGE